ncbi:PadR family transcriptional regulator [Sphingomonas sp. Leaf407]|nr:PadR family transcriptional regulator [Sphingomonas sp. Leaf42]KQT30853.1 PadR family transcriptional regulator [Sphingomonas sp. Leaf407]
MFSHHHHHAAGRGDPSRGGPFGRDWPMGRGGRPGGGGGGGRRIFDGSELRLLLLRLVADEPRHGYELIKAVEALSGGAYAPSPGVVYPTLTLLTDMGLTEEQAAEGTRKRFAATEAGHMHLAESSAQVAELFARLQALGERHARTDGGPIHRAKANLRAAIHHRLSGSEIDADTLHAVAAILDDAAQKVERL